MTTQPQSLEELRIRIWRESECASLGITDDELSKLLEINSKMEAAGFVGWYTYARDEIRRNNPATLSYYVGNLYQYGPQKKKQKRK